ncbi:MAG TPA: GntR family transcriptional regulator [Steroidobacteraceae bacterium]|nr:GntR family transcriptional regulator [Steroidobacteraceae bacterium]
MSGSALKRTCMRDRIRDVLIERILDGTYPAGMQLKELALAREFNVSQAPIREALRELEGSGLVTSERFRGTRVRGADLKEMRESYELRSMMEERAVELAAPVSPALLEELEQHVRQMARAVALADPERYIDGALAFHRRLIEASGNRAFLAVWDSLHWDVRGRVALRQLAQKGGGLKPLVELHRALCARLRKADTAGATAKVRAIFARIAAVLDDGETKVRARARPVPAG